MNIEEIKTDNLRTEEFINQKVQEIYDVVGDGLAVNALSGGVDSSAVTILGHKALGDRLKTYFINNGLMRDGEPERIPYPIRGWGSTRHSPRIRASDDRRTANRTLPVPARSSQGRDTTANAVHTRPRKNVADGEGPR